MPLQVIVPFTFVILSEPVITKKEATSLHVCVDSIALKLDPAQAKIDDHRNYSLCVEMLCHLGLKTPTSLEMQAGTVVMILALT